MTDARTEQNGNGHEGSAAVAEATRRVITPKSLKLPRVGFEEVKPLVEAMVALNGASSRNLIFDQAGASASGGTAKKKWAALGYYGFRTDLDGSKFDVSERGQTFVSGDADRQREAKQHALISTGFQPIIARFSTRPANQGAIAGILREDFGVPETTAANAAAELLIALATEAGFIVGGTFKAAPIEQAMEAVPARRDAKPRASATRTGGLAGAKPKQAPKQPAVSATPKPPNGQGAAERTGSEGQAGPFGLAPVQVVVNVDASKLTGEQIAGLVRALQEPAPKTTS